MEFHAITESKGSSPLLMPPLEGVEKKPSSASTSPIGRIVTDGMQLSADLYERVKLEGREVVQMALNEESPLHPSLSKVREAFLHLRGSIEALGHNHPYERSLRFFLRDIVDISTAAPAHLDASMAKVRTKAEDIYDNSIPVPAPFEKTGIICVRKVPKGAPDNLISKEQLAVMTEVYQEIKDGKGGLRIEGNAAFKATVLDLIATAITYPRGFEVLEFISTCTDTLPIRPGAQHKVFMPLGEDGDMNLYQMTLNFDDSQISKARYLGLSDGKAYACKHSEVSKFIHECIHAEHFINGLKECQCHFNHNPDFVRNEGHKWSNSEERVTIGIAGDKDTHTENTFKGERNVFLTRDGHRGIPKLQETATDIQMLSQYIDLGFDGEVELMLKQKPEMFENLTKSRKLSIKKGEITKELIDAELTTAISEKNLADIVSIINRHKNLFTIEMYIKLAQSGIYDKEGVIMTYLLTKTEFRDATLPDASIATLGVTCGMHFPHLIPTVCLRLIEQVNDDDDEFDALAHFRKVEADFIEIFTKPRQLTTQRDLDNLYFEIALLASPD